MRDMKYYIYTCESDGSEAPLTMIDGKIIEFETEARAAAFLNELRHSSIFDEESEEFKQQIELIQKTQEEKVGPSKLKQYLNETLFLGGSKKQYHLFRNNLKLQNPHQQLKRFLQK